VSLLIHRTSATKQLSWVFYGPWKTHDASFHGHFINFLYFHRKSMSISWQFCPVVYCSCVSRHSKWPSSQGSDPHFGQSTSILLLIIWISTNGVTSILEFLIPPYFAFKGGAKEIMTLICVCQPWHPCQCVSRDPLTSLKIPVRRTTNLTVWWQYTEP